MTPPTATAPTPEQKNANAKLAIVSQLNQQALETLTDSLARALCEVEELKAKLNANTTDKVVSFTPDEKGKR